MCVQSLAPVVLVLMGLVDELVRAVLGVWRHFGLCIRCVAPDQRKFYLLSLWMVGCRLSGSMQCGQGSIGGHRARPQRGRESFPAGPAEHCAHHTQLQDSDAGAVPVATPVSERARAYLRRGTEAWLWRVQ